MSDDTRAFEPLYGPSTGSAQGSFLPSTTVTASASAAASTRFSGGPGGKRQVQIANKTTAWAHVNFGDLSLGVVTAATVAASYPVAPGGVVVVTVASGVNAASVILDAAPGTATAVVFTVGSGL